MRTRKELMRIMPVNAHDIVAAERIIEIGYPEIAPVMPDMVNAMRVATSPVGEAFAAYFGRLGEPAVQAIGEGLLKEDCSLRYRIFTIVLPQWPAEVVAQLKYVLTTVATHPDAYNNDLLCMRVLLRQRLVDLVWIGQWLTFKREGVNARNELLLTVEKELERAHTGNEGGSPIGAEDCMGPKSPQE